MHLFEKVYSKISLKHIEKFRDLPAPLRYRRYHINSNESVYVSVKIFSLSISHFTPDFINEKIFDFNYTYTKKFNSKSKGQPVKLIDKSPLLLFKTMRYLNQINNE